MTAERGSVSVIAAAILAMAALLMLLLGEVGVAARARTRVQAAADAAALAAARSLLVPGVMTPHAAADTYARRNGAELISCRCAPGSSEAQVAVVMKVPASITPGRIVRASARAVVEAPVGGAGLQPWFAARVACLLERVPGTRIASGFRTRAQQAALHRRRPSLAAPPGRSLHELGLAVDLSFPSTGARRDAHARAGDCGLTFPMTHEPWHAEALP